MHRSLFGGAVLMGILSACGTSEYDWQRAYATHTLAAYQAFVKNHPKSKQAEFAQGVILAMQDDQAWKAATSGHSKPSYQQYLAGYRGGLHADQARLEITALDRATAWRLVEHDADYATLDTFLKQYPQGPESNVARDRVARMTYRAKFAHASTQAAADRQLERLHVRLRGVLDTLEVIPPSPSDKEFEVASGLLDPNQAQAACTAAAHEHQHCEVVSGQTAVQS